MSFLFHAERNVYETKKPTFPLTILFFFNSRFKKIIKGAAPVPVIIKAD